MITSPSNERIKAIRRLHERKEREATNLAYIEGLRIVGEAAQQNAPIELLIVAPELIRHDYAQQLISDLSQRGVEQIEVSSDVFTRISLKDGPQGVAAVVRRNWSDLNAIAPVAGSTWMALDSVADPGNLGTILRTHEAVGGQGVILLDQCTDPYDPSAVRASMGAVFSQKLVRARFAEFAAWKQATGATVIGTSDAAQADYHAYQYPAAPVLLMGSERQGLQAHHLELCDAVVAIPMIGGAADSLNLAVASAVVLYEVLNQRRTV